MSLKTLQLLGNEISTLLRMTAADETAHAVKAILGQFATDIDRELSAGLKPQYWEANPVRGLRHLPQVFHARQHTSTLHRLAAQSIPDATWSEFYAETDWSARFLSSFTTGELVGASGSYASDSLILGLFLMGPDTYYPAHAHPAEEFYLVVSGDAEFQNGVNMPFQKKVPGEVIVHQSNVSHAIRTTSEALFAIYGWRGALNAPSWFSANMQPDDADKVFPEFVQLVPRADRKR